MNPERSTLSRIVSKKLKKLTNKPLDSRCRKPLMEQCQSMTNGIESELGSKAIQIHLHREEGHFDELEKWKPNLHGHIVFD